MSELPCVRPMPPSQRPIPEDQLEPKPPATFTCPTCGKEQDVVVCKCGDPICEKCDPESEMHVRCLPPERMTPYLLLQDCDLTLLRIKKALHEFHPYLAYGIAENMERVLRTRNIR